MLIVASYNVRGLPKDGNSLYLRPDIVALLEKGDIVCMQETWYSKQDLDILNNLHPNFSGTGVSTTDYQDGLVRGHPPGGGLLFSGGKNWIM